MSRSSPPVYDAFGRVPDHIAPSVPVRRWDQGIIAAAATFGTVWCGGLWLGLHAPGPDILPWSWHVTRALGTAFHWATMGISAEPVAREYLAEARLYPWQHAARVGIPLVTALAASTWVALKALKPRTNTWHISGNRLLEGKEAIQAAVMRSLSKKEREADRYHLALHPNLVLPKKHWSRGTLIYGSVGSGKTQILLGLIQQIVDRDDKLFLYDVKGDFTAKFRRPIILSPFDRRSWVWDIGRDVRTPTQAAAFAASLIPDESGNGKFWSTAAQQLLTGAVRSLQNDHGIDWGWPELARQVSLDAPSMLPMLQKHYIKAAALIANPESQTTTSLLSTLAGYTRVIDDLALAWPKRGSRMFAITDWVRDDYAGRKQVIVQAGVDPVLTRSYIAALINIAEPAINSPLLPDNEEGRSLAFIIDELTSIGRLNVDPLIARGRSKGVVAVLCVQDLAQMDLVYGKETTKALSGMVGTHIVCQVQVGETRDLLAQKLGKHKVAWRTHDDKAQVHEESRALVSSVELTDKLGFRKAKHMGPHGWGIRAIVLMGGDPLLLDFPGIAIEPVREGQVPAKWTTRPAGARPVPEPKPAPHSEGTPRGLTVEQVMALEMERLGFPPEACANPDSS